MPLNPQRVQRGKVYKRRIINPEFIFLVQRKKFMKISKISSCEEEFLQSFFDTPASHRFTAIRYGTVVEDLEAQFLVESDILFRIGEEHQFLPSLLTEHDG